MFQDIKGMQCNRVNALEPLHYIFFIQKPILYTFPSINTMNLPNFPNTQNHLPTKSCGCNAISFESQKRNSSKTPIFQSKNSTHSVREILKIILHMHGLK